MCEYCENGKNIELTSDSGKSYWFILRRRNEARLYCKMGESESGNAYGIKILRCPICGEILTKKENTDIIEIANNLIMEIPHGNRYRGQISHVKGTAENCEVTIRLNMLEDRV